MFFNRCFGCALTQYELEFLSSSGDGEVAGGVAKECRVGLGPFRFWAQRMLIKGFWRTGLSFHPPFDGSSSIG